MNLMVDATSIGKSPISIGWILSGDRSRPSARICGYNLHDECRRQGIDSNIIWPSTCRQEDHPIGPGDKPEYHLEHLRKLGCNFLIIQKRFDRAIKQLINLCHKACIRVTYYACDPIENARNLAAVDGIIATSIRLKELFVSQAGVEKSLFLPDAHETPDDVYKLSYISLSTLKIGYLGSRRLDKNPFPRDIGDYELVSIGARTILDRLSTVSPQAYKILFHLKYGLGKDLPIPNKITWNENRFIKDIINCDITILPESNPEYQYKSNNRLTQLMSLGLPVIAFPLPAYVPIIHHGENGFFAKSTEEWGQALHLLRDTKLREKIGRKARKNVFHAFHVRNIVQKFLDWLSTF